MNREGAKMRRQPRRGPDGPQGRQQRCRQHWRGARAALRTLQDFAYLFAPSRLRGSIPLIAILLCTSAHAATVRTLDGKTYDGDVKMEVGALVVTPRAGSVMRIELGNLLQLSARSVTQAKRAAQPPVPPPWSSDAVGKLIPQATAGFFDGIFSIKGSGHDIGGTFDGCQFVHQMVSPDAAMVSARIKSIQNLNSGTKAGVMIRKSLDVGAPFVFLGVTPDKKLWLIHRPAQGATAKSVGLGQWNPLTHYRLQRARKLFAAASSVDARTWQPLGEKVEVDLGEDAIAGIAVTSHDRNQAALAQFDFVNVTGGRSLVGFDAAVAPKGILFRNGTLLAGSAASADDTTVKGSFAGVGDRSFPAGKVARIYYRPVTASLLARIPRMRSSDARGVLLARGDFMEGELVTATSYVTIRSIQFGESSFITGTAAAALVLADSQSPTAGFSVRTANGSIFMAESLKFEKGALTVQDQVAGAVTLTEKDVTHIRTIGGRFDSLADVRPSSFNFDKTADPARALVVDGTPAGVSLSLSGAECDRGLGMAGGASITYSLDGKYRSFLASVGVPAELVPMVQIRFIATADGKEVFRSPEMSSLDDAMNVSISLDGVKNLTLQVEGASAVPLGGCGVWGEPLVVKKSP